MFHVDVVKDHSGKLGAIERLKSTLEDSERRLTRAHHNHYTVSQISQHHPSTGKHQGADSGGVDPF